MGRKVVTNTAFEGIFDVAFLNSFMIVLIYFISVSSRERVPTFSGWAVLAIARDPEGGLCLCVASSVSPAVKKYPVSRWVVLAIARDPEGGFCLCVPHQYPQL